MKVLKVISVIYGITKTLVVVIEHLEEILEFIRDQKALNSDD